MYLLIPNVAGPASWDCGFESNGCFVCCECFVLSGRGLCDELITRPEESYRLWCVVVCDLENLMNEEPYPINMIELNIGDTSLDVFPTCH